MAITVEVFWGDGALPIRLPTSSSLAKCSNTQLVHQLVDRLHRLMILFVKYERIGAGQRSSWIAWLCAAIDVLAIGRELGEAPMFVDGIGSQRCAPNCRLMVENKEMVTNGLLLAGEFGNPCYHISNRREEEEEEEEEEERVECAWWVGRLGLCSSWIMAAVGMRVEENGICLRWNSSVPSLLFSLAARLLVSALCSRKGNQPWNLIEKRDLRNLRQKPANRWRRKQWRSVITKERALKWNPLCCVLCRHGFDGNKE